MSKLSHIDRRGNAKMVDVTAKQVTKRFAKASGFVKLQSTTIAQLRKQALPKGDVLTVAKIAGIQAAKNTANLIPLCHPLSMTHVDVTFSLTPKGVGIKAMVKTTEKTGAEMEALTAVSVAALTIYDMCKAIDKIMEIGSIRLEEKTGGKKNYKRKRP